MPTRKIAICGSAPSWAQAPFKDADVEIWSLGVMWKFLPRQDRHFELHLMTKYRDVNPDHIQFLQKAGTKAWLQSPQEDMPEASIFPKAEIIEHFGNQYFTNSVAWMTALALYEQRDEMDLQLSLYGCDMAQDEEYAYQRPCCEYWLGVARGLGAKVSVTDSSDLLHCRGLYGYEMNGQFAHRLQSLIEEFDMKSNLAAKKAAEARDYGFQLSGNLLALEKVKASMNGDCPSWLDGDIAAITAARDQARVVLDQQERAQFQHEGSAAAYKRLKQWN